MRQLAGRTCASELPLRLPPLGVATSGCWDVCVELTRELMVGGGPRWPRYGLAAPRSMYVYGSTYCGRRLSMHYNSRRDKLRYILLLKVQRGKCNSPEAPLLLHRLLPDTTHPMRPRQQRPGLIGALPRGIMRSFGGRAAILPANARSGTLCKPATGLGFGELPERGTKV